MTTTGMVEPADAVTITRHLQPRFSGHVELPDDTYLEHQYFDGAGPRCIALEFPAPARNAAHFHDVDQFQIFLPSAGTWLQRHDIDQVTLHYTDAYVAYGPFGTKGPDPLCFFTLRAENSGNLTGYPPEDRPPPVQRGRRNYECSVDVPALASVVDRTELIAPEEDGLAAYVVSAGGGQRVDGIDAAPGSAGQYHFVLQGTVVVEGRTFGPRSIAWCPPSQRPLGFDVGSEGCVTLLLQFPRPTVAEGNRNVCSTDA